MCSDLLLIPPLWSISLQYLHSLTDKKSNLVPIVLQYVRGYIPSGLPSAPPGVYVGLVFLGFAHLTHLCHNLTLTAVLCLKSVGNWMKWINPLECALKILLSQGSSKISWIDQLQLTPTWETIHTLRVEYKYRIRKHMKAPFQRTKNEPNWLSGGGDIPKVFGMGWDCSVEVYSFSSSV